MSRSETLSPLHALRDAEPGDRALLLAIYASTRAEELAAVPWPPEFKQTFLAQQFDAQDRWYRTQYRGTSFRVVLVDDAPAGRLYLASDPAAVLVLDIALLPDFRGMGLGTRLLRAVMHGAAAAGQRVVLHVTPDNPARRLYERLGFVIADSPTDTHVRMEWASPPLA